MTPAEFATYRAAETMLTNKISAPAAIALCRSQARTAAAAVPQKVCPNPQCYYPPVNFTSTTDSNGTTTVVTLYNNVPTTQSTRSSSGQSVSTANGGLTTMSNGFYVVVNNAWQHIPGPIPAWTHNVAVPGLSNVPVTMPGPAYVPQSGWMLVPGTGLSMYIDPSGTWGVLEMGDPAGKDYFVATQSAPGQPTQTCGYATYNNQSYSKCWPPQVTHGSPGASALLRQVLANDIVNGGTIGTALVASGVTLYSAAVGASAAPWLVAAGAISGLGLVAIGTGVAVCWLLGCFNSAAVNTADADPWPGYEDADTIVEGGYGDGGAGGCFVAKRDPQSISLQPSSLKQPTCITDDGSDEI